MNLMKNRKKSFFFVVIVLCLSILTSACAQTSPFDVDTLDPSENSVPEDALLLFDGEKFTIEIVLSEYADRSLRAAAFELAKVLQALTSSSDFPVLKEDFTRDESEITTSENEILIGKTNRFASKLTWDRIQTDFCFSVNAGADCVVVVGSNDWESNKAVVYFTEIFLPEHLYRSGEKIYLRSGDYQSPYKESTFISRAVLAQQIGLPFSYTTEPVLSIPSFGTYSIMQGACLDSNGIFAYFILRDSNDLCSMVKYDMRTGELVASNENIGCDHGNDMCYNPNNGTVVVSHCTNHPSTVSVFRADTLELMERKDLSFNNSGIGYNAERRQYVIIGEGQFRILDETFKVVQSFPHRPSDYTSQGIHCDENYIYRVESSSSAVSGNILEIYDWSGNYVLKMELSDITLETETIFHLGKDLYINCYAGKKRGGILYKMTIETDE